MKTRSDTKILEALNKRKRGDIEFSLASDEVVGGLELKPVSGGSVSVSQVGSFMASSSDVRTGRKIAVGHVEQLWQGELRCFKQGDSVCVAAYLNDGSVSRVLKAEAEPQFRGEGIDEGEFTWFGPVEYYGTPWSDNDPLHCQVITVNRLRTWAGGRKGR